MRNKMMILSLTAVSLSPVKRLLPIFLINIMRSVARSTSCSNSSRWIYVCVCWSVVCQGSFLWIIIPVQDDRVSETKKWYKSIKWMNLKRPVDIEHEMLHVNPLQEMQLGCFHLLLFRLVRLCIPDGWLKYIFKCILDLGRAFVCVCVFSHPALYRNWNQKLKGENPHERIPCIVKSFRYTSFWPLLSLFLGMHSSKFHVLLIYEEFMFRVWLLLLRFNPPLILYLY